MLLSNMIAKAITNESDIVSVRQIVKDYSIKLKFTITNQTKIITAASEIARNVFKYGGGGNFTLSVIKEEQKEGLQLVFEDSGPGIEDIDRAMQDGYTTGKGLGLGLSGSARLVDKFFIKSSKGHGTIVTLIKWKN